jgi:hypothetical protein
MTLFKNQTHKDIWIEHHCERCARHPGCPIVLRAIRTDRKPPQWDRSTRKNVLMQDSIKCREEVRKLPRDIRRRIDIDVPMFDVTPVPRGDEGDHA